MGRPKKFFGDKPRLQRNHPIFLEIKREIAPHITMNEFTGILGNKIKDSLFEIKSKESIFKKQEEMLYGKVKKK